MSTEHNQDGKGDAILPQKTNSTTIRWYAVSSIKTPPFSGVYADVVRETLRQHGCTIEEHQEHVLVTFPSGTRKRATHLQTLHERYRIMLPDGYELYEIYMRQGLSILALFADR
jgi:hypothetical protein